MISKGISGCIGQPASAKTEFVNLRIFCSHPFFYMAHDKYGKN